jgi:hypothetical protein
LRDTFLQWTHTSFEENIFSLEEDYFSSKENFLSLEGFCLQMPVQ